MLNGQAELTTKPQDTTHMSAAGDTAATVSGRTPNTFREMDYASAVAALTPAENKAKPAAPTPPPPPKTRRTVQVLHDEAMRTAALGPDEQPPHLAAYAPLLTFLAGSPNRPIALARFDADTVQARGLAENQDNLSAYAEAALQAKLALTDKLAKALDVGLAWRRLSEVVALRGVALINQELLDVVAKEPAIGETFTRYIRDFQPELSGKGLDSKSIVAMLKEGTDFAAIRNALPTVHNVHRFEKAALVGLQRNLANTDRKRPLLVIVHTATDYNGGFHRDAKTTELICHSKHRALLIEVSGGLAAAGEQIRAYAQSHGVDGKVQRLMIAGHGLPTEIELADGVALTLEEGRVDENDEEGEDKLDPELDEATRQAERLRRQGELDQKNEERAAFLGAMRESMADNGEVLLNACLGRSVDTDRLAKDGADPEKLDEARLTMARMVARDVLQDPNDSRVHAGQAAIFETDMISAGGKLRLKPAYDKASRVSDRLTYIARGLEAVGFVAAVADSAVVDLAATRAAVAARAKQRAGGMAGVIVALARICERALVGEAADLGILAAATGLVFATQYGGLPSVGATPRLAAPFQTLGMASVREFMDALSLVTEDAKDKLALVTMMYLVEPTAAQAQAVSDAAGTKDVTPRMLFDNGIDQHLGNALTTLTPRSSGGRRLLLVAAARGNVAVAPLIAAHMMTPDGATLDDKAMADIIGLGTPDAILRTLGLRGVEAPVEAD